LFGSEPRNASSRPSGDQKKERTPLFPSVSLTASPPSTRIKKICGLSSRSDKNASVFPSGDHRGENSDLVEFVNCLNSRVLVFNTQRCRKRLVPLGASLTTKQTRLPSGERCTSDN